MTFVPGSDKTENRHLLCILHVRLGRIARIFIKNGDLFHLINNKSSFQNLFHYSHFRSHTFSLGWGSKSVFSSYRKGAYFKSEPLIFFPKTEQTRIQEIINKQRTIIKKILKTCFSFAFLFPPIVLYS